MLGVSCSSDLPASCIISVAVVIPKDLGSEESMVWMFLSDLHNGSLMKAAATHI